MKVPNSAGDAASGDAASSEAPPQYTEEGGSVNVLIVGESQQGKSTLIRQLNRYAGLPELDIGIGYGNVACTKGVGEYQIPTVLRRFRLADNAGKTFSNLSYTDSCDLQPEEAQVLEVEDPAARKLNFIFIDTPGLDDSDGDDLEIMAGIIGRVGEMDHINALVYVRSVHKPFGASFKQFFNYIQHSMPSLSNGLVMVHSCFSVDKVEEFLADQRNLAVIRRDAFKAATNLDLQHFFMDNEPDPSSPFAVSQSLNEIYRLLTHLSSQRPLPLINMKVLKTDKMKDFDIHVISPLNELTYRLEKAWTAEKSTAKILEQNTITTRREIAKTKNKLAAKAASVKELRSGSDILLGTKSCVEDYSFVGDLLIKGKLNLGRRRIEYDSDCRITQVTKSCSAGSQWLDEDLRGTSWRATLTAGIFRDISGTATFYTTSAIKNHAEIKALDATINDLEETLAFLEDALALNGVSADLNARATKLGEDLERTLALVETLKRETFEVTLWPLLKRFYAIRGRPSFDNVREFVGYYDEVVSKLL